MFNKLKRRKTGESMTEFFIGIMILVIIGVAVAMPVVQDVVDNSTVTGTAGTLLGYVNLLLAALLIIYITKAM